MSLVSSTNYKLYLKITDTTRDTELALLYGSVERRIKEYLGRDLEWAVYTDEFYSGNGTDKIVLNQFPIIYVSAIKRYDGITSGNVETWTTLVEHTDYDRLIIDKDMVTVFLDNGCFDKGDSNYKITYMAGYTDGSVLSSGNPVVGTKYSITARSSVDFTLVGASANTVGTQFVATGTGVTLDSNNKLTELITLPEDIQLSVMELLKVTWDNSPVNQNRLGFLSTSNNAGSGSENLSIDSDIENKILRKIERYRAVNV